jgi:hypothetical protein
MASWNDQGRYPASRDFDESFALLPGGGNIMLMKPALLFFRQSMLVTSMLLIIQPLKTFIHLIILLLNSLRTWN